jgi:hypothetical protein
MSKVLGKYIYPNPKFSSIKLPSLLGKFTPRQSEFGQSPYNKFFLAWRLSLVSFTSATKTPREENRLRWKISATDLYHRVYSMLKFILYQQLQASAKPGIYLNQGGYEFFP